MNDHIPKSAYQIGAIRVDLDKMYHFSNLIEKSLSNEVEEVEEFKDKHGDLPSLGDELWNLTKVLPYLYRGSAIMTMLGFFEHNLNVVCESLRKEFDNNIKVTDLNGKGLKRSKLYISKEIGIAFPVNSEAWQYLLKLSDIRNLIAHRDSLVKEDNPELIRFIKNTQHLSIDITNRVRLHDGALNDLVDYLHLFFKELSDAICEFSQTGKQVPGTISR